MTDMHDTGIVRRVDELGRIVIPMELRRTLGIQVKDPLAIYVEGDRIILAQHHEACVLCGQIKGEMVQLNDRPVCHGCVSALQAMS